MKRFNNVYSTGLDYCSACYFRVLMEISITRIPQNNAADTPDMTIIFLAFVLLMEPPRYPTPLPLLQQPLRRQGQNSSRHRPFQYQRSVIQADAGQDRLAVAACADQTGVGVADDG